MLSSMTGYGRAEITKKGITVTVELRSVNNRFLEVTARLPRSLSLRENEIKEFVRRKALRGKVNLLVGIERENGGGIPLKINTAAARGYYKLLNELRKTVKLKEKVKLEHLLHFTEVIEQAEVEREDEEEWGVVQETLGQALDGLAEMRRQEGRELEKDFRHRIGVLEEYLGKVEELSRAQVPAERARLRERIKELLEGETVDEGRLELELAILADRLDVTEECVRFRSHNKFFLEALDAPESAGRKLNFLIQEMNREANTIGSKVSDTAIAHLVVHMKEELEKIREQLQNIE
ncbi:MAG: YicC family protein [Bacteroidetes bacterium]|jgi:uncharacterized protein (TIGR00255 family)|nr:YicC family protein [Bacteroidota bacterium]